MSNIVALTAADLGDQVLLVLCDNYDTVSWHIPEINVGDPMAIVKAARDFAKKGGSVYDQNDVQSARNLLDFVVEMEKGVEVQGAWFDYAEFKHLFTGTNKPSKVPIKGKAVELAKLVRDLVAKTNRPTADTRRMWRDAEQLSASILKWSEEKGYKPGD